MSDTVNISDLAEYGEKVPAGEYTFSIANVVPKRTKSTDKPMLEVHFQVEGGDYDGDTVKQWYVLTTFLNKKGKPMSYGISDIKAIRAAAGIPLPKDYPFPLDEVKAGKEFQPLLKKKLVGSIYEKENYRDKSKMDTVVKITGVVGGAKKTSVAAIDEEYV